MWRHREGYKTDSENSKDRQVDWVGEVNTRGGSAADDPDTNDPGRHEYASSHNESETECGVEFGLAHDLLFRLLGFVLRRALVNAILRPGSASIIDHRCSEGIANSRVGLSRQERE